MKARLGNVGLLIGLGVVLLLGWIYAQQAVQPLNDLVGWARLIGLPGY